MRFVIAPDSFKESMSALRAAEAIARGLHKGLPGAECDLIPMAEEVERRLMNCTKNITVAVMGCAVNGPGEAAAADIGIAGGKGEGLIFRKGEILYKVPQEQLVDKLMEEIEKLP